MISIPFRSSPARAYALVGKKIKKGNVLVHMSKDNKELEVKDQDPVIKEKVKVKPKILKRVEGSYEREINYRYDGY